MTLKRDDVRPAQRSAPPLWLLAMLTLSGTLAIHIFVPALPKVVEAFNTTTGMAQLTLSTYVIGLAIAQVIYGPMADYFGRRPVMAVGMTIFALSGAVALFAASIEVLIVARFFEAIGGGAGLVLGRTMVRDGSTPEEAARKLSLMNLMVMIGPGVSPLIGSALAAATGWRSIFAVLCLLGLVNLLLIWRRLPPSQLHGQRSVSEVAHNYFNLCRSSRFLGYAIGGGFSTTAMYAYLGAAPFIFVHQLNRPVSEVGLFLALNMVGPWLGSLTASRLVGRSRTGRLMIVGNLISCCSVLVLLLVMVNGQLSVAWMVATMFVFSYGAGMTSPMALTEALSLNPAATGSASGLYGFMQMMVGALCAALSGLGDNPALATAVTLMAAGIIAQLSFWVSRRPPRQTVQPAL